MRRKGDSSFTFINSTSSWLACNYITWDWGVEQQVTGSVHTHNTNQSVVHKNKNLNGVFPSGWAILYIKKIFRLYSKYTLIILRKKPPVKTVLQNKSQSFSQCVWISYGDNTCLQKRTVLFVTNYTHTHTHTHSFSVHQDQVFLTSSICTHGLNIPQKSCVHKHTLGTHISP